MTNDMWDMTHDIYSSTVSKIKTLRYTTVQTRKLMSIPAGGRGNHLL